MFGTESLAGQQQQPTDWPLPINAMRYLFTILISFASKKKRFLIWFIESKNICFIFQFNFDLPSDGGLQSGRLLKGHKRSLVSNFSYFCYGSAAILYYTCDVLWNLAGFKKILLYVFFSTATGRIFFVRTIIHWITVVIWHALALVLCHSADNNI